MDVGEEEAYCKALEESRRNDVHALHAVHADVLKQFVQGRTRPCMLGFCHVRMTENSVWSTR